METDERCRECGGKTRFDKVKSAFWEGDRLVVVEDIPALICEECREHFYDDETVIRIDMLRGEGFSSARASREIRVPVFSLKDRGRHHESE